MVRSVPLKALCALSLVAGIVAVARAAPADDAPIEKPLHIDRSFTMLLSDGCRWSATVVGDVKPVKGEAGCSTGRYEPNLRIGKELQCPNAQPQRLTETLKHTGALTHEQLEKALEYRSAVSSEGGRSCMYEPDYYLTEIGLRLRAVSTSCPLYQTF